MCGFADLSPETTERACKHQAYLHEAVARDAATEARIAVPDTIRIRDGIITVRILFAISVIILVIVLVLDGNRGGEEGASWWKWDLTALHHE